MQGRTESVIRIKRAGGKGRASSKRGARLWFLRDLAAVGAIAIVVFVGVGELVWLLAEREVARRTLVEIEEGASVRRIASTLESAGLVKDAGRFVSAARFFGLERRLKAGAYEFGPTFTELEILFDLKYGEVAGRLITVPEGYRASQIAELLEDSIGTSAAALMVLVHDRGFVAALGVETSSLEGYLHPETYRVNLDAAPEQILKMMVDETWRVFDARLRSRAESLGFSVHEILTLASIVEAEAVVDSERRRISAVYHNRLENGWRLEADPTVRYAIGNYRRKLYYTDLEAESPYNTYRRVGLPPGPICSPGEASILAALYALEGSDEFFFVSNGDGTHTFSRTFDEHIEAKRRIRREREQGQEQFSLDGVSSR